MNIHRRYLPPRPFLLGIPCMVVVAFLLGANTATSQLKLNPPSNATQKKTGPSEALPTGERLHLHGLRNRDLVESPSGQSAPRQLRSVLEQPLRLPLENTAERMLAPLSAQSVHSDDFHVAPELNQLLTQIVLNHLPHHYANDKKWGKQAKRWAGVDFRRDSPTSRLETKRKYKMVNHGTWQKYSAQLVDPNNQFSVELSDFSRNKSGAMVFDVRCSADLDIDARQAKWVKGVQLYSLSAEGSARVRLGVRCELETHIDVKHFPPDLVFSPTIVDAEIVIEDFRLDRVSKLGGEVAQQLTRRARKELEEKIDEKERKLVKKLNRELEEKRDRLRLSAAEATHLRWFREAQAHLPSTVRRAVEGIESP